MLGVLVLAFIAALGWLVVVYPDARVPTLGKTAAIELDEHSTLSDVATQLAHSGLVTDPQVFAVYARVLGAEHRLRHGRVLVTDAMNARELLQRVAAGLGSTELRITIPEGFNRFDIADRLAEWGVCERDAFLQATATQALVGEFDASATDAEGYLFPDTYRLRDGMAAADVARRMLSNSHKRLSRLLDAEAVGVARLRSELGFGLHELVTLASIVEKEAHAASEQAIIAGVFWNRLHDPAFKPHRLQADPTVAYGCFLQSTLPSCQGFDGKRVTRLMTSDAENRYNTYRLDGLPPGPIANPGLGAVRAVLNPASHGYYYFVARGDGHHSFSASLTQHNQAVMEHRSP